MPQKPPDLDENLNPIKPPDLDESGNPVSATAPIVNKPPVGAKPQQPQSRSLWQHFSEAPQVITDIAHKASMAMTEHSLAETSPNGDIGPGGMLKPYIKGFGAGAMEAAASMLSPLNILTAGRGPILGRIAKTAGAGQVGHGVYDLTQGNYLQGAADIGFGILGMNTPTRSKTAERLLDLHAKDMKKGIPELKGMSGLDTLPPDIAGTASIRPQFNPKGQTGMTGSIQQGNLANVAETAKKPRLRQTAEGDLVSTETGAVIDNINDLQEPAFARTEGGGIKIGADTESLGKILGQSLYSKNIAISATKELIQNSLDAVKHLGTEGKVDVKFDRQANLIGVSDNGEGMTREQVETVLTDLGRSGKSADEDIGGFGLAKASFLLGGEHVSVSTVARDPLTGKLKAVEFDGTPDDLLRGIELDEVEVPEGTPTGTSITVKVPKDSEFYKANEYVDTLQKYSDYPGKVTFDRYGNNAIVNVPDKVKGDIIAEIPGASGDAKLIVPTDAKRAERGAINLILTNRGMYQGTQRHYLGRNTPNMPESLIIDISSKVPVKHEDYPFTANRESLRGSIMDEVVKYINENLVNPALGQYKNELIDTYNTLPTRGPMNAVAYDPSGRLTSKELDVFMNHPMMTNLYKQFEQMVTVAFQHVGDEIKADKLEKIGFIFTERLRGIHIPSPETHKSAILINPLQIMRGRTPDQAAAGWVHTILHELTHMKVGEHNESFTIALGDIHEKFGGQNAANATRYFQKLVGDGAGGYNTEAQKLLQKYIDSRGREGVDDNLLTRTGIGSEDTGGSEGDISQFINALGNRTLGRSQVANRLIRESGVKVEKPTAKIITTDTAATVQRLAKEGYQPGGVTPDGFPYMIKNGREVPLDNPEIPGTPEEKASVGAELYNFARGLSTSWDLSAPLRQGLPLVGTRAFWRALPDMIKALGDKGAYDLLINEIKSRPLFKEDYDVIFRNGQWYKKRIPSYAEKAGLAITDLKTLTNREENLMSRWAEKVPGVKASNRAYSVFLNKLRADHFETLINDAKGMDLNPENNLALGKEIADFVNTATGRGPLRTYRPTFGVGKETSILGVNFNSHLKESSVEESAKKLTHLLFSPRLVASRIRMLNPATYIAANPFVRKQYLKSMLHTAGAWTAVAGIAKMAGAQVVLDPTNSDFGKIKIGNTRLDPAAGFQQYLVLASRLMMGKTTPSTRPNRPREFGKGYQAPTRASIVEDFTVNKLHPVLKFAYDLYDASEYKSVQMADRILQMYVPLVVQDVVELAKEDPKLIPLSILTGLGMGTQTYQKGEQGSFAIPPSLDYTYKGGSPF